MQMRVGLAGRRVLLASTSIFAFVIGGSSTSAFADSCAITRTGPGSAATVSNPSGATVNCINIQNNFTVQCRQHQRERQYRPTQNGITIDNSSVGGAISNSDTITASNIGIAVGTSEFVANTATVSGGITNGGTISITGSSLTAAGISITNVTSASGGISNSGEILAGAGGGGISLQQMTSFSGGISNTGTIVTGQDQSAISAGLISTFIGEVSNPGSITVGGAGYGIGLSVGVLSGNVENSGQITAPGGFGISVNGTTLTGNISNSGTISVGSTGINVGGDNTGAGTLPVTSAIPARSTRRLPAYRWAASRHKRRHHQQRSYFSSGRVLVVNVGSLGGNISNSGTISASTIGIYVGSGVTFGPATPSSTPARSSGASMRLISSWRQVRSRSIK